jgi:hypothetical protein
MATIGSNSQVTIPEQTPIGKASWDVGFNPSAYIPPNNDRTPVNPINAALSQEGQQAQIGLQQGQAANAISEVQQRQRAMQASILGAWAKAPPEQAEASRSMIMRMVNGINPSYQIDPNIDQKTGGMVAMSSVPVQEQPQYNITQTRANILSGIGGGQGMSDAERLAIASPESSNAIYNTPEGAAQKVTAEKNANNQVEANKNAIESQEGYGQLEPTINALKTLAADPNLPQQRAGMSAEQRAAFSQNFGNQQTADTYNTFNKINESDGIKAIQSLASNGQIKMTKALENMVNRGYLIDPNASPTSKVEQANAVDAELKNSMIAAQNVSAKMNGGKTQPYASPYSGIPASMRPQQSNTPIPAGAVAFLKSNPNFAAAFEQKYGVKADKYLGSNGN